MRLGPRGSSAASSRCRRWWRGAGSGEYDFLLRLACVDAAEFETVVDTLKRDHGVRELRSRLVLHELDLDPGRLLELQPAVRLCFLSYMAQRANDHNLRPRI